MLPMEFERFLTENELPGEDDDLEEGKAEENEGEGEGEEEKMDELTRIYNQEIEDCFAIFDKNKTGMIDTRYAEKALEALGIHLSYLEMEEAIDALDTEGVVFFDQFQPLALEKMHDLDKYESLKEAFQVFDPDNEGIVPSDRLKRCLMTLGNPLPEKEAKDLIKMGDPSNKGFIQYEMLVRQLLS